MRETVTILGSGGSMGIPVIACKCPSCLSQNPKDRRQRAAVLLQTGKHTYLLDPGPDIRKMALEYKLNHVDAVFLTHPHDDHIGGMNDLRPYNFESGKPITCITSQSTWDGVSLRFHYLLNRFDPLILQEERGCFTLNGDEFCFFTYSQEATLVTGYRYKDFAYVTDIKNYEETIFTDLQGVSVLVVSALHKEGSRMHFSHKEAVDFGKRVGAKRVIFTHVNHETVHDEANKTFPSGMELAYDGMVLNVGSRKKAAGRPI